MKYCLPRKYPSLHEIEGGVAPVPAHSSAFISQAPPFAYKINKVILHKQSPVAVS